MTAPATHGALRRLARPLQNRSGAGWLAVGLGSVTLLLGAAAWVARLGWLNAPYWVLIAWVMALIAAVAVMYIGSTLHARLSAGRLARRLEDLGAWRRGTLTALLDTPAAGTSDALFTMADQTQADEIARRGAAAVEPLARPVRVLLIAGGTCLLAGVLAFASAGPV